MKDQNYAAMSEHVHVDGVYPFPAVLQTRTIETNGTSIHVRVGGSWSSGRHAARLRHNGRHVGSSGERTHRRPHDCRARPAWVGPLVEA